MRRIGIFMLIGALLLSCMAFSASAAGCTIAVENVSAAPGETVDVPVSVQGNPGIQGATLTVSYDAGLTLIGAESGEAFSPLEMTPPGRFKKEGCNFLWYRTATLKPQEIKDGTILTLKFTVSPQVQIGTELGVYLSYEDESFYDSSLQSLAPTVQSGTVTVGSAKDDGTISAENVSAAPGETVDVPVSIQGNPGIQGATLTVAYDAGLTLTGAENGEAFSLLEMTPPGRFKKEGCSFLWYRTAALQPQEIKDGTILTLKFTVSPQVQVGTVLGVYLSYEDESFYNSSLQSLTPATQNGTVTVVSGVHNCVDTDDDNLCDECGKVQNAKSIAAYNITLGNELRMNFAVVTPNYSKGVYAMITHDYADKDDTPVRYDFVSYNGSKTQFITTVPVSAKEMNDTISVVLYDAQGRQISEPYTRSVREYAVSQLNDSKKDAYTKAMVADMLVYGAAAQTYFNYRKDAPVTNGVDLSYATENGIYSAACVQKDTNTAMNLTLGDSILLNVAVKGYDETMTAEISFTNHSGKEVTRTVSNSEFVPNGPFYMVVVNDIVLADARQAVTVKFFKNGVLYSTFINSLEAYVSTQVAKTTCDPLYPSIMRFADSAYAYLHRNDKK